MNNPKNIAGPGLHLRIVSHSYWLLLVAGLLFCASLYQRVLHMDEAWIGEQAYWAAKEGIVRSELFRGLMQAESRQLVYHWLFVWQAAGIIRVLGWSVAGLKLISFCYLLLFIGISYRHLRRHYLTTAAACGLFYALLLTNTLVVEYGYVFRPEIMVMCLGFGSWMLLHRSLRQPGATGFGCAAGAGLLAGLAALTHLNGLIFIVAGAGLLLWRWRPQLMLTFGVVATAAFSVYFLDIIAHNSWAAYLKQLTPAVPARGTSLLTYGLQVFSEHKRFLHSPLELVLTLLVVGAGLVLRQARFRSQPFSDAMLYLLLLVAGLACLAQGKTTKYLLLYMPHLCLLIALAFEQLPPYRTWQSALLTGLLVCYVAVNFGYTAHLISRHEDQPAENRQLARYLAAYRHAPVVAPLEFVFPEIDEFSIQGITCYQLLLENQQTPAGKADIFAMADYFKRQLIILDDTSLKDLGIAKPVAGRRYGQYRYASRFKRYYIYKHL